MTHAAPDTAYFQIFTTDGGRSLHWRLLAGNNRELGRSAAAYDDREDCQLGIKTMLAELHLLDSTLQRQENGRWSWRLRRDGEYVALSGTSFDRRARCAQAIERFRAHASAERVRLARSVAGVGW